MLTFFVRGLGLGPQHVVEILPRSGCGRRSERVVSLMDRQPGLALIVVPGALGLGPAGLRQLSPACIYIIYAVGKEFRNVAGGGYRDKAMTHFMTSSACCGWESHNFHVPSDFEVLWLKVFMNENEKHYNMKHWSSHSSSSLAWSCQSISKWNI